MEETRAFRILLADSPRADDSLIQRLLSGPHGKCLQFSRVSTYVDAIYLVRNQSWDAVLVNQDFGSHQGLELIHNIWLWGFPIPLILLSDRYEDSLEYRARRVGATEYFAKDALTSAGLLALITNARQRRVEKERNPSLPRFLKNIVQKFPIFHESY